MKIEDCNKRVDYLFNEDLSNYLKEHGIFCIKYLKESKLKEYLIDKDVLYKEAIEILELYRLNKDRLSHNICKICENKNKMEYYQTSIFNLGSFELSSDYLVNDVIDYYAYLEALSFNKMLEDINPLNNDLDILQLCPRILKQYFQDLGFKTVEDMRKMSYIEYELIPEYLLPKFNKFLEWLKCDAIHVLQEEFIKLVTNEEERKLVLLKERIKGLSLNDTGLTINLSKEWVRILELQIVNDFEHFIIRRDYKLYRLVKYKDEVDIDKAKKYFGKYFDVFNYLYHKNLD